MTSSGEDESKKTISAGEVSSPNRTADATVTFAIAHRHRPMYDGLTTDDELLKKAYGEYMDLQEKHKGRQEKKGGEETTGLSSSSSTSASSLLEKMDFSNTTSMWIAYERYLESQRPDHLFCDPLAKYFVGPSTSSSSKSSYGEMLSDIFAVFLKSRVFDSPPPSISDTIKEDKVITNKSTGPSFSSSSDDDDRGKKEEEAKNDSDDGHNTVDVGFGLEGHVMYTAARTKLINNHIEAWLSVKDNPTNLPQSQLVNVGAGMDTRVYWLEALRQATTYHEVDTPVVVKFKQSILDDLATKQLLPEPMCQRRTISIDFSSPAESIMDLPSKYEFDTTIPTCWILEGLIMYLERHNVQQLLDDISSMSAPSSLMILNFTNDLASDTVEKRITIDEIEDRLLSKDGWVPSSTTTTSTASISQHPHRLMFGDEGFNFGRYPKDKPSNKVLGFAFYTKT